ncbi:MAG: hypothetical protein ACPG6Z_06580 [Nitrosopumilus sp.]
MELLDDKMRVWLESAKFVKSISPYVREIISPLVSRTIEIG